MECYRTVYKCGEGEIVEKKSRFIAEVYPVTGEEEAFAHLEEVKKRYWDARHHCWAYVIGRNPGQERMSDDGEPAGTAGKPILEVIRGRQLTDVFIVVTRYFGGILLGGGGLVRAYSHGASIALQAAGVITMRECSLLRLTCDYSQYGRVGSLIPECGGVVDDTQFAEAVTLSFHMAPEQKGAFARQLADATNGQVTFEEEGMEFFQVEE